MNLATLLLLSQFMPRDLTPSPLKGPKTFTFCVVLLVIVKPDKGLRFWPPYLHQMTHLQVQVRHLQPLLLMRCRQAQL
ncbi:hypothetical protein GBA52_014059 [Prunus armeniaca]|nr:hypothetical protein GBA52_014059 [Prunus armeniaca]